MWRKWRRRWCWRCVCRPRWHRGRSRNRWKRRLLVGCIICQAGVLGEWSGADRRGIMIAIVVLVWPLRKRRRLVRDLRRHRGGVVLGRLHSIARLMLGCRRLVCRRYIRLIAGVDTVSPAAVELRIILGWWRSVLLRIVSHLRARCWRQVLMLVATSTRSIGCSAGWQWRVLHAHQRRSTLHGRIVSRTICSCTVWLSSVSTIRGLRVRSIVPSIEACYSPQIMFWDRWLRDKSAVLCLRRWRALNGTILALLTAPALVVCHVGGLWRIAAKLRSRSTSSSRRSQHSSYV